MRARLWAHTAREPQATFPRGGVCGRDLRCIAGPCTFPWHRTAAEDGRGCAHGPDEHTDGNQPARNRSRCFTGDQSTRRRTRHCRDHSAHRSRRGFGRPDAGNFRRAHHPTRPTRPAQAHHPGDRIVGARATGESSGRLCFDYYAAQYEDRRIHLGHVRRPRGENLRFGSRHTGAERRTGQRGGGESAGRCWRPAWTTRRSAAGGHRRRPRESSQVRPEFQRDRSLSWSNARRERSYDCNQGPTQGISSGSSAERRAA